ncbi:uncharacterized protein A4U43_C01F15220 [Asparagus officinalis]|uniref:Uncharacterized protein n=1 Tax=Asparagus officinalis TaxID=4686 RepID=A0A5P1FS07_ASPOF|nr:uncharacterized protein A4U43_C01F15220 [Asparagus officinalis]
MPGEVIGGNATNGLREEKWADFEAGIAGWPEWDLPRRQVLLASVQPGFGLEEGANIGCQGVRLEKGPTRGSGSRMARIRNVRKGLTAACWRGALHGTE